MRMNTACQCVSAIALFLAVELARPGQTLANPVDQPSGGLKLTVAKPVAAKPPERKPIVHQTGEPLSELAKRIVPHASEILAEPVEMALPPLGQVIVFLYEPPSDGPVDYTNYRGIVLVPEGGPGNYRQEALPPIREREGQFEFSIKSIFSADADGDGAPELCVLAGEYRLGSGEREVDITTVNKWSGKGFVNVDEDKIEQPLVGLHNAKSVRARLKMMLSNHPASANKTVR